MTQMKSSLKTRTESAEVAIETTRKAVKEPPLLTELKGVLKITEDTVLLWAKTQLWKSAPLNNTMLRDMHKKITALGSSIEYDSDFEHGLVENMSRLFRAATYSTSTVGAKFLAGACS